VRCHTCRCFVRTVNRSLVPSLTGEVVSEIYVYFKKSTSNVVFGLKKGIPMIYYCIYVKCVDL